MMSLETWLRQCPGMFSVQLGKLILDGKTFEAALYKQTREGPAGCRNPGHYLSENIYILGEREKKFTKGHWALTMKDDVREWYFSCYITKDNFATLKPEQITEYHPLGISNQISPWPLEHGPIDKYEQHPYKRVPVEFIPV